DADPSGLGTLRMNDEQDAKERRHPDGHEAVRMIVVRGFDGPRVDERRGRLLERHAVLADVRLCLRFVPLESRIDDDRHGVSLWTGRRAPATGSPARAARSPRMLRDLPRVPAISLDPSRPLPVSPVTSPAVAGSIGGAWGDP